MTRISCDDDMCAPLLAPLTRYMTPGSLYCIGVSGGKDSLALLLCMHHLCVQHDVRLHAVHFHHHIRGEDADGDAAFCEDFCAEHDVPCTVLHADVPSFARESRFSMEEAARECRLRGMIQHAHACQADALFLAHHADDQAETLLMRLFRGAGVHGLAGMCEETIFSSMRILRPWLALEKKTIHTWFDAQGVTARHDASNDDQSYTRNWVRHTLMPLIQERYDAAVITRLARTAAVCRATDEALIARAEMLYAAHTYTSLIGVCVPRTLLCALHDAELHAFLRLFMSSTAHTTTADSYEKLIDISTRIRDNRACWYAQLTPERYVGFTRDIVYTGSAPPAPLTSHSLSLSASQYSLTDALTLSLRPVDRRGMAVSHNGEAWHDVCAGRSAVMTQYCMPREGTWRVRPRQKGDAYRVVNGSYKKGKSLCIDAGIPRVLRDSIPVVTCDDDIVWYAGWRVAASHAVPPGVPCIEMTVRFAPRDAK